MIKNTQENIDKAKKDGFWYVYKTYDSSFAYCQSEVATLTINIEDNLLLFNNEGEHNIFLSEKAVYEYCIKKNVKLLQNIFAKTCHIQAYGLSHGTDEEDYLIKKKAIKNIDKFFIKQLLIKENEDEKQI